ncbi:hypothetical protein [Stutzerimonas kunmingensis]|uniref:hypothetical protein n=1 Tax=Stutzerimonas kunmingensis TaxID=1211807 RepID=UPI0028B1B942|nr:hypothetical protein [Stutzerimonas kunmingensis]
MFVIGVIVALSGLVLSVIENRHKNISSQLESYIKSIISEAIEFQEAYRERAQTLSKIATATFKEAAKGPQFKTVEEHISSTYTSIENIKTFALFYFVTFINFLFLIPFYKFLSYLNKLGKGRALGGVSIMISVIGVLLACLA